MKTVSVVRLARPARGPVPLAQLPPLALYVHLPWCLKKCPYCDFNSHEWRAVPAAGQGLSLLPPELEQRYLDALQADLEASLPLVWGRSVQTVFIGGGTPSLFSPAAIEALLATVRARLRLAPQAEITLEANPGSFETGRFAGFARAGVTRLSIGVQSFDDGLLRAIGRVHDGAQARAAVAAAARHFETFSLDLMYALPGQTLAALGRDIDEALSYRPPHLSAYHLTLEPNTLFAKYPPALPDDDLAADMQALLETRLGDEGLRRYEISAWARTGHQARHNLNYWQFGDYLGIGAGAHGKLSFHDGILRQSRLRHPERYMQAALGGGGAIEQEHRLQANDLPFEFMLNALRLVDGVPASMFTERTGLPLAAMARALRAAGEAGLLDPDPALLRATPLGLRFLNDLQEKFLEET
ncbi:MAG: radical SAM family heme chaperone HemW [Burkholderiales bacterium]|nr:radical SAM family heme chaperone HemW [Burkholderiales bacterium]